MLLAAPNRVPLDSLQILHHNLASIHRFSKGHQSLRSGVEEVPCYGGLSVPQPLKEAAGRAGANTSDFCLSLSDACSMMVECASSDIQCFVRFWLNGHKKILNSRINADYGSGGFDFWNSNFYSQDDVPLLASEFEFGVAPSAVRDWTTFEVSSYSKDCQAILGEVEVAFPADGHCDFLENCQLPPLG